MARLTLCSRIGATQCLRTSPWHMRTLAIRVSSALHRPCIGPRPYVHAGCIGPMSTRVLHVPAGPRYKGFSKGIGKKFAEGKATLEEMAQVAAKEKSEPPPPSGRAVRAAAPCGCAGALRMLPRVRARERRGVECPIVSANTAPHTRTVACATQERFESIFNAFAYK